MATPTSNSVPVTAVNPASTGSGIYLVEGHKWGGALGTAVTLTYSFPTGTAYFIDPYNSDSPNDEWSSWSPLTTGERDAVRDVLATWSSFARISFVEVADNASVVGELRFAYTENIDPEFVGHAYYPSNHPSAGDVWLSWYGFNPDGNATVPPGTFDYHTILHEVGHALGLKHPFSSPNVIPDGLDNFFYTIMSYTASPWSEEGDSYSSFAPTTPMYYDLLAIQALYGRNTTVNSGNTTYTFNDGTRYWEAINDGGGHDVIVYNGSEDSSIDLTPGAFSELSEAIFFSDGISSRATVTIGPNVVIEDARGGSGNDTLRGNSGANVLSGGAGNDTFRAWAGADTFNGDAGTDTLSFVGWGPGVSIDLSLAATQAVSGGSLKLSSIENIVGGNGADTLRGNNGANVLSGGAGNDTLNGGFGADAMFGGSGNDIFVFDNLGDRIDEIGGSGIDQVQVSISLSLANTTIVKGDVENLALLGSANLGGTGNGLDNVIVGNTGTNTLIGAAGNDTLNGGFGSDTMQGGSGNDIYVFDNLGDRIDESVAGSSGTDTIQSFISLSLANTTIVKGNVEHLTLIGSANIGATGNAFNNILTGNAGNNALTGGAGMDNFLFNTALNAATNVDQITDFSVADDTVRLENAIFSTLATGTLAAAAFHIGAAAADALDRLIYNAATGALVYDFNGSAAGGATQFATLDTNLALSNQDFFVI